MKVIPGKFVNDPKKVVEDMLSHLGSPRALLMVAIHEDGSTEIFVSDETTKKDLALMAARAQGYMLAHVNDWDEAIE